DLDFPFIESVNWQQNQTVSVTVAMSLLRPIQIKLSAALGGGTRERNPQAVQVWFEPDRLDPDTGQRPSLGPIVTLHGNVDLGTSDLTWTATDTVDVLTKDLSRSGRILIRVHCGHLFDGRQQPFSAALDALGLKAPHLPGGVFEGWFFVRG